MESVEVEGVEDVDDVEEEESFGETFIDDDNDDDDNDCAWQQDAARSLTFRVRQLLLRGFIVVVVGVEEEEDSILCSLSEKLSSCTGIGWKQFL